METYTVTISPKAPLTFNGVTIRKAMLQNGDYVDVKAFHADPNASNRAYVASLEEGKTYALIGKLRTKAGTTFRELVVEEAPTPKGKAPSNVPKGKGNPYEPDDMVLMSSRTGEYARFGDLSPECQKFLNEWEALPF